MQPGRERLGKMENMTGHERKRDGRDDQAMGARKDAQLWAIFQSPNQRWKEVRGIRPGNGRAPQPPRLHSRQPRHGRDPLRRFALHRASVSVRVDVGVRGVANQIYEAQTSEVDSRRGCATGMVGEYRGPRINVGQPGPGTSGVLRCSAYTRVLGHPSGELYCLQEDVTEYTTLRLGTKTLLAKTATTSAADDARG